MISRAGRIAVAISLSSIALSLPASAVTLNPGQSARINFVSSTATPPFDFVTLTLNFSNANPFGKNESLAFSTFDANNSPLTSTTFSSGDSVFTSGLFASLTQNAIVPFNVATALKTTSFSAIVTDLTGSFDLTAAQANFEHILTSGANQFGVVGTISQTPLPAALPLFATSLGAMGLFGWRRRKLSRLAVN